MRELVVIDLAREQVPDATKLLKLRRLLEDKQLTQAIVKQVNVHVGERGLLVRKSTLVDATVIGEPPSNQDEGPRPRPRDAPSEEGQPAALRHEGGHWRQRRVGPRAQRARHGGQRQRRGAHPQGHPQKH